MFINVFYIYIVAWLTENSQSFLRGLRTSWATESPVTGSRAMQRLYPKSVRQRASPWRLTTLPARGWGPAIEHCRRATSSPSAQEERRCVERWVTEGSLLIKGIYNMRSCLFSVPSLQQYQYYWIGIDVVFRWCWIEPLAVIRSLWNVGIVVNNNLFVDST